MLIIDFLSKGRNFWYSFEPISLVCSFSYLVNRFWLKPKLLPHNHFIHYYLNDLLTFPVALPFLLMLFRMLKLREDDKAPSFYECIGWFSLWSILFEFAFPFLFKMGVSDSLDVVFYAVGLIILVLGIYTRQLIMQHNKTVLTLVKQRTPSTF